MEALKERFSKNGLEYQLIQQNNKVALFALSTGRHWEISLIYIQKACTMPSGNSYPDKEIISSNDQFGIDGSRTFGSEKRAISYFNELSSRLNAGKSSLAYAKLTLKVKENALKGTLVSL